MALDSGTHGAEKDSRNKVTSRFSLLGCLGLSMTDVDVGSHRAGIFFLPVLEENVFL